MQDVLKLVDVSLERDSLSYCAAVGGWQFNSSFQYHDLSFDSLINQFGEEQIDWICFHLVALDITKFCSLAPAGIDFGPYAHLCSESFFQFWQKIVHHVWAQWRYENDRPDYRGPKLVHAYATVTTRPIQQRPIDSQYLVFCGGGKDSLVAMRALDRIGVGYGAYVYTHSVYGCRNEQARLIQQLADQTGASHTHVHHMSEGLVEQRDITCINKPNIEELVHAETPCSIFGALPSMLAHGYRCAVLAHERSADTGNLVWDKTGEEINHQWGKSWEAEAHINDYIRQHLIADYGYFSILKPITDVVIFGLLANDLDALPHIHSCNIDKPWCKRCAKCAYVWLNLKAYLPAEQVDEVFGVDLFDIEDNLIWFRQMLGLEKHTPFECVGQVQEARLALALYLKNTDHPVAANLFKEFEEDFTEVIASFTTPVFENTNLDPGLRDEVMNYFNEAVGPIRQSLLTRLAS